MNAKRLIRFAVVNTGIALLPPIIMLSVFSGVTPHQLWSYFLGSLIYAHSIGWLGFTLMPRAWTAVCELPAWQAWTARAGAAFAITLAGGMIACLIFVMLGWIPLNAYWSEFRSNLKIATFITILVSGAFGMYHTFRARLDETELQLRTRELDRARALKLATEAQLASLESRIHPHFLFNTLNSISALIPEDPARAERLVEQMAALLRFSLDANQHGMVPLTSEFKIVSDYLEIEKARFGDRLRYQIEVAPGLDDARVPPLSVQTLVENSVKHGIAHSREGGEVRIAGQRENGLVRVEISDFGPPFRLEAAPAGHGLDNLKSRLSALFGERAALTLSRSEGRNSIVLSVPQAGENHAGVSG